jgi:hypothetical protein
MHQENQTDTQKNIERNAYLGVLGDNNALNAFLHVLETRTQSQNGHQLTRHLRIPRMHASSIKQILVNERRKTESRVSIIGIGRCVLHEIEVGGEEEKRPRRQRIEMKEGNGKNKRMEGERQRVFLPRYRSPSCVASSPRRPHPP